MTPPTLMVTAVEPPPGVAAKPSVIETGPLRVFRLTFSTPIDRGSLTGITPVTILDATSGDPIAGSVFLEEDDTVLVFRPEETPPAQTVLQITVSPEIQSRDGARLELEGGGAPVVFPAVYLTFQTAPSLRGPINASVKSSSAIEVSWAEVDVEDNTAPSAKMVEIFAQPVSSPLDPSMPTDMAPLDARHELVTNLAPATTYRLALRVADELGNKSNLSEALTASTPSEADTLPPTFDGIGALEVVSIAEPHVLRARWQAAVDDHDAPELIRYFAYLAMEAGAQDFELPGKVSAPGATEMVIDGLPSDTAFFVIIRAADTSGNEDANTTEAVMATPASFQENVFPIFTRLDLGGCTRSSCHSASFPRGGLNMTTYEGLIRGGTHRNPTTIVPGDGQGSYLLWRTDRSNPHYERTRSLMPLGRPPLSGALLSTIERWIDQGAANN